jgi:hypothetical protein
LKDTAVEGWDGLRALIIAGFGSAAIILKQERLIQAAAGSRPQSPPKPRNRAGVDSSILEL